MSADAITITFAVDCGQVLVRLFDRDRQEVATCALSPEAAAQNGLDLASLGLTEMSAEKRGGAR